MMLEMRGQNAVRKTLLQEHIFITTLFTAQFLNTFLDNNTFEAYSEHHHNTRMCCICVSHDVFQLTKP